MIGSRVMYPFTRRAIELKLQYYGITGRTYHWITKRILLNINDISKNISSNVCLFADNCIVHRPIKAVKKNLDETSDWAYKWQLKFNVNKCVLLSVTRNHSSYTSRHTLNNQTIQSSDTYKLCSKINYHGTLT